jgi:hypothetical protein
MTREINGPALTRLGRRATATVACNLVTLANDRRWQLEWDPHCNAARTTFENICKDAASDVMNGLLDEPPTIKFSYDATPLDISERGFACGISVNGGSSGSYPLLETRLIDLEREMFENICAALDPYTGVTAWLGTYSNADGRVDPTIK